MDAEDLALFERSIRGAVERADLDAALDALGWSEALAVEPRAAVSVLFEAQGRASVTSSALDRVVGGVLLPALGRTDPPGTLDGDVLTVTGLALGDPVMVVARDGDKHVAVTVDGLNRRPVAGIDPSLGLVEVTGEVSGVITEPFADWSSRLALGQLALGHELVGASRTMLDLARTHALERVQFGQPISGFQAIRHRLAETLVAIETAEAVLDAAWLDQSPQTAAMAKALAGRGARTAARHCQQVLAGIGFTTEHDLHRYVRRTLVLDQLLGSARTLTRSLGDDLLATRQLPALLPL